MTRRTPHDGLAPSLHPRYRRFAATTSQSANPPRIGTQHLTVSAARWSPSHQHSASRIGVGLPTFPAAAADQARVAFMPDTTWPVSGHPPGSSRRQPEAPVSMSCSIISTRRQRFTHVRLPDPHLTPHWMPFPHRSPPRPHSRRSMRWFEASPTQGDSEGPTFISCTAPSSATTTYTRASNVRGTPGSDHCSTGGTRS